MEGEEQQIRDQRHQWLCRLLGYAVAGGELTGAANLLLEGLLRLTGSRCGCIGEVRPGAGGTGGLRTLAAVSAEPAADPLLRALTDYCENAARSGRWPSPEMPQAESPVAADKLVLPLRRNSAAPGPIGLIALAGAPGGYDAGRADLVMPLAWAFTLLLEADRRPEAPAQTGAVFAADPMGLMLRTQLGIILGHTQVLGLAPGLGPEERNQLEEIARAGEALLAFAGDRPDPVPAARAAPEAAAGYRLLVVEDHPPNQAVLRMQLETLGYTADIVGDGRQALDLWRNGQYGLILTDLKLPELDGLQLTRIIREQERRHGNRRTPIIALTAADLAGTLEACLAAGMDEVLAKPADLMDLDALLRRRQAGPAGPAASFVPRVEPGSERSLLALFNSVTRQALNDCGRLLRFRDAAGLAEIMHKLKSSAQSVGAGQMAQLAADLEQAARNGQWLAVTLRLERMEEALRDFEASSAEVPALPVIGAGLITPEHIRQAILSDAFEVHFQPRLDSAGLRPSGVEALPRWRSDRHGWVPPEVFLLLAERHDLIGPLSELLLTKALLGGARLREAGFPLEVAVHLSPYWLAQPRLPEFVLASIRATGIPPGQVVLEVPGAAATASLAVLARLREQEIGLAVDDFNVRSPAPATLRKLGFSQIKVGLDIMLGEACCTSSGHAPECTTLAQARHMGLVTVLAGVETPETLESARALGSDRLQGDWIAEAMPVEKLIDWLRTRT